MAARASRGRGLAGRPARGRWGSTRSTRRALRHIAEDRAVVGIGFTQIGGSGTLVGTFTADETTEHHIPCQPTDQSGICTNEIIRNNRVYDVTNETQGTCGIACGHRAHVSIEHNEVADTNSSGVSLGYGWTGATHAMTNNNINHNHVHRVARILTGGAGIDTLST